MECELRAAEECGEMRQAGRGAALGRGGSGKRGARQAAGRPGRGGHWARVPPYQAAQIVLLRLHRERGGAGQHPAGKIDAAAQVQVLGLADRSRRGQGARIHYLGHGSGESLRTPMCTLTPSCQTARLRVRGGREGKSKRDSWRPPGREVSQRERRVGCSVAGTTSSMVQCEEACALLPGSVCMWRGAERTGNIPERRRRGGEWGSCRRSGGPTEMIAGAAGRSTECFHFSFVQLQ